MNLEDLKELDSFGKTCDDEHEFWFDDGSVCVKVARLILSGKYWVTVFHSIDPCKSFIIESFDRVLDELKLAEEHAKIYRLHKFVDLSYYNSEEPYWKAYKAKAVIKPLGDNQYKLHFYSGKHEDVTGTPEELASPLWDAEREEEALRWLREKENGSIWD